VVKGPSHAVIGANYGDEGKGLITDYLVRQARPDYVVRFNGGAQAGHTVVTELDNQRHVFKYIGCVSFVGVPTILSEHFIVNPILFNYELASLDGRVNVRVMVDERALVTTPFDMLINQTIERARGGAKHGSCGVGINETVTRSEREGFALRVQDLTDTNRLRQKLETIRESHVPQRIMTFGFTREEAEDLMTELRTAVYVDAFIAECVEFLKEVQLIDWIGELRSNGSVVFEGAQGLALDEHAKDFPHVTRSRTGLTNVVRLSHQLGIKTLKPVYVTRAYLTRHGNGPLKNELLNGDYPRKPYRLINEKTNVDNEHQGRFRYAYLDIDALVERVKADVKWASMRELKLEPAIAVTCLDQVDEQVTIMHEEKFQQVWKQDLPFLLKRHLGFEWSLASEGPTADDVRRCE